MSRQQTNENVWNGEFFVDSNITYSEIVCESTEQHQDIVVNKVRSLAKELESMKKRLKKILRL